MFPDRMGNKKKNRAREQAVGEMDTGEVARLQNIIQIPGLAQDPSQGSNVLGRTTRFY